MVMVGLLTYLRDSFEELEAESKVRRAEVCIVEAFGFEFGAKW